VIPIALLIATARAAEPPEPAFAELGTDVGRGNVVAIQPWMTPADYASTEAFHDRLATWFAAARERGWFTM
jgi:hypothetical protein